MPDQVSEIGVKLTLDATQFKTGLQGATTALNTFRTDAATAASGAASLNAGGGKGKTGTPPGLGTPVGVNVALTVTPQAIRSLRSQIISGLGTIPINVSPTMPKTGPGSAQSIIGTVFSAQYGLSPSAGRQIARQAMEIYQPKAVPRAAGGPVRSDPRSSGSPRRAGSCQTPRRPSATDTSRNVASPTWRGATWTGSSATRSGVG